MAAREFIIGVRDAAVGREMSGHIIKRFKMKTLGVIIVCSAVLCAGALPCEAIGRKL